jgi:hypothetical protein
MAYRFYGSGQSVKKTNFDASGIPLTALADTTTGAVTATVAEINALHSQAAVAADFAKLHAITASAAEVNKVDGLAAGAYLPVVESRFFTETTGAGTYTATVTIPANTLVFDVCWNNIVVWDAATSATLNVGDAGDADGYVINVDVKTAPAAGSTVSNLLSGTGTGAYKGKPKWYESAGLITATVVTVGATGSAGRSRLNVIYMTPTATNATKA